MLQSFTLQFLKDLKKNNNKYWFDEHRKQYESSRSDFLLLIGSLKKSIANFDHPIGMLNDKECVFRINRDVRFSKNKDPYKNNMAGYFNKSGKKGNGAGYYLHVEPGKTMVAGGIWMPLPADLAKIRQEIDYNFADWKKVINNKTFSSNFGKVESADVLVRPPKGYDENNPAIGFLKMKNFFVSKPFTNAELLDKAFVNKVAKTFKAMKPMIDFLNKAIA